MKTNQLFFKALLLTLPLLFTTLNLRGENPEQQRVLFLGAETRAAVALWKSLNLPAKIVELKDPKTLPKDGRQLAALCDTVVVYLNRPLEPEAALALESFVRGGGGLIISVPHDWTGQSWAKSAGSPLDLMSPSLAADVREFTWVTPQWDGRYQGARFDLAEFPRLRRAFSAAPPDETPLLLFNMLSPLKFSKPLWNREWATPWRAAVPEQTAILSTARYGAGKSLFFGGSLLDDGLVKWPGYAELCQWLLAAVAPAAAVQVDGERGFVMRNFHAPAWWEEPLASGLKAMGQPETVADFLLPPDALTDSGWWPAGGDVAAALLFGKEAGAEVEPGRAAVRLPKKDGEKLGAVELRMAGVEFDPQKLQTVAKVEQIIETTPAGAQPPRKLPCKINVEIDAKKIPTVGVSGDAPEVKLPEQWKIAFTYDANARIDAREGWHQPKFDDAAWADSKLERKTSKVFGKTLGFDGAIWYRGWVDVAADAVQPGSVLLFNADCHVLAVYVDGKEMLFEPGTGLKPALDLSLVGKGRHLLAIRTYGELRSNFGLLAVTPMKYPIFWKPDARNLGWSEQEQARKGFGQGAGWIPCPWAIGSSPINFDARAGWVSFPVEVPEQAAPFNLELIQALNNEAKIFINGALWGQQHGERMARCLIPQSAFKPGRNVVSMWVRAIGNGNHRGIEAAIRPVNRVAFTCSLNSPADGASVLAVINFEGVPKPSAACEVLLRVNGTLMGAVCDGGKVFAPMCLKSGVNEIEVLASENWAGAVSVASITAVLPPDEMNLPVPAWERLAAKDAPADWYSSTGQAAKWEPATMGLTQDWRKIWMMKFGPEISQADYLYRAWLQVPAGGAPFLSLLLRNPSVKCVFVNGQPVRPLQIQGGVNERCLYPLGAALKPGLNLIAVAPDHSSFKDFEILMPGGRDGKSQMPELLTTYAPIEPAVPELGAYQLNLAFRKSALPARPGAKPLFKWPDGSPAISATGAGAQRVVDVAPGLLDDLLPGAFIHKKVRRSGPASVAEYEYSQTLWRDLFLTDRVEQLLPALASYAQGRQTWISGVTVSGSAARVSFISRDQPPPVLLWRCLDWQGQLLGSGTSRAGANYFSVPIPDTQDRAWSEGSGFSRAVRLRATLMSPDFRTVHGFIEKIVSPERALGVSLRFPDKLSALSAETAPVANRTLHSWLDTLVERRVFLPNEPLSFSAHVTNQQAQPVEAEIRFTASGALTGKKIQHTKKIKLLPFTTGVTEMTISADDKKFEEPWTASAEVWQDGQCQSKSQQFFTVAAPRGTLREVDEANQEDRHAGGYMWGMGAHAYAIEHRSGYDAAPASNSAEWWRSVRFGGDGNWLVAEGVHRGGGNGDQNCLLWGPFYEQRRGEIIDSYGWFPNGMPFRGWWAPYAQRELARKFGHRPVVVDMSDWWQYECGPALNSFSTVAAFDTWLKERKGQTVAGTALDGSGLAAPTLAASVKKIQQDPQFGRLFAIFGAETLAGNVKFSNDQFCEIAPGSVQSGQCCFVGVLPALPGGAKLALEWTNYETIGILDADNHPFAGDWQYGIETASARGVGVNLNFVTGWEAPMRYHYVTDNGREHSLLGRVPLDSPMWIRRQLDSRWTVVADGAGGYAPVLNTTHSSHRDDNERGLMLLRYGGSDYSGLLPHHWQINDLLSQLSTTILPQEPLSPLLVAGENGFDFYVYSRLLGRLREAGLPVGGAVSSALLRTLAPEKTPGLIWASAAHIDAETYADLRRLMNVGVPVLFIGNLPAPLSGSGGLPGELALTLSDSAPAPDAPFTVASAASAWPELAKISSASGEYKMASAYTAKPTGVMTPLLLKGDLLALGRANRPDLKAVFLAAPGSPVETAPLQAAVRAFNELRQDAVTFPDGATGYAFKALDGRIYVVVQNLTDTPLSASLSLSGAISSATVKAASQLTGQPLPVTTKGQTRAIEFSIPGKSADVVVIQQ